MRWTRLATGVLTFACFAGPSLQCQVISTAQARAHDDENATVCGVIGNEHTAVTAKGKPTFLDLDSSFPNQVFTILVWDDDRAKVGALPQKGNRVCVTGLISYYHGVPQMVVRDNKQFSQPK